MIINQEKSIKSKNLEKLRIAGSDNFESNFDYLKKSILPMRKIGSCYHKGETIVDKLFKIHKSKESETLEEFINEIYKNSYLMEDAYKRTISSFLFGDEFYYKKIDFYNKNNNNDNFLIDTEELVKKIDYYTDNKDYDNLCKEVFHLSSKSDEFGYSVEKLSKIDVIICKNKLIELLLLDKESIQRSRIEIRICFNFENGKLTFKNYWNDFQNNQKKQYPNLLLGIVKIDYNFLNSIKGKSISEIEFAFKEKIKKIIFSRYKHYLSDFTLDKNPNLEDFELSGDFCLLSDDDLEKVVEFNFRSFYNLDPKSRKRILLMLSKGL